MLYRTVQVSDLHLIGADPFGIPTTDGLNTRVHKKLDLLHQVIDYAIEIKANELTDLGDLFNSINPSTKMRNAVAREYERAILAGIRVVRIPGNHETDGREADGLDASLLSGNLFHVVAGIEHHPTIKDLLYIPEIEYSKILEAVQQYSDDMIFGHFGVSGVVYSSGIAEENGIPQIFFSSRSWPTFLGHIHKRQYLCAENVVYIGAIARANFGDKDILTGCCVVDLEVEDGKIQSYKHAFKDFNDISLHELEFTEETDDGSWVDINLAEGDIIKITYEGSHDWYALQDTTVVSRNFLKLGAAKVLVNFKPVSRRVGTEVDVVQLNEDLELERRITDQAKADDMDPKIGIDYYRKAVGVNGE